MIIFLKKGLKKVFPNNPLFYFGWLGLLGVTGLIIFTPTMIPFLLFFSFFSYYNMVPDELFWKNVHESATRAFWVSFTFSSLSMVILFLRAIIIGSKYKYHTPVFHPENVTITLGGFAYEQMSLMMLAFLFNLTLMLLVFSISMMHYRHKEKKSMQEMEE